MKNKGGDYMMKEKKSFKVELFGGYSICCDVIPMGKDFSLAVYGGDTPHIGSVAMSTVRPSLTGVGNGVTTSVLNGIGHKDDIVAKLFAEAVAMKAKCVATCICGIHVDNISSEQIKIVKEKCAELLEITLKYFE